MKLIWIIFAAISVVCIFAEDTPGFFLKVTKNVPRLGKRNNFFMKQGTKNIPRLGRRSFPNAIEELKYYNHVQPFDSKFMVDFLSDELVIGDGDLKFVSWNDFDKALESDTELYHKLTNIARDKEIEELKKLMYQTGDDYDNEVASRPRAYGDPSTNKIYQKFIPFDGAKQSKYNNRENEVYYYNNEVKRGEGQK